MTELVETPVDLETEPEEPSEEAPYGYKADGTPRAKPGRKSGSGGGTGGATRRSSASLQSLREPLIERLVDYGAIPLAMTSPIAAAVWEDRAEKTADAILVLAGRSKRWRKWVERFVAGTAAGDLGITFAGVFAGMLVDAGRMSPNGKMAHYYGIDEIYEELYGAYVEGQNGDEARGLYAEVV